MNKHQRVLLEELIDVLRTLRVYGMMTEFVDKFNEETKGKRHRNFGTRIISGEVNFSGSLIDKLIEAHRIALQLYDKIDLKRKMNAKSISLNSIINKDLRLSHLEEQIFLADSFYFKGQVDVSISMQKTLLDLIDLDKLSKNSLYIENYLILMYARNLSQFANSRTTDHILALVNGVIKSLRYNLDKEPKLYSQALTLRGLLLRQSFKSNKALKAFGELKDFALYSSLKKSQKNHLAYMANHQLAITYLKKGNLSQDSELFLEGHRLLSNSNDYFSEQENENWYIHCKIREIEALIKCGEYENSEKMILEVCNPSNVVILNKPQQVIYLRILAEKYARTNDIENANKYFEIAIKKANNDGYLHEIELLQNLSKKFDFLEADLIFHE